MIVLDATAAVQACLAADGFDLFGNEQLIAPPLLWSEVSSAALESNPFSLPPRPYNP